MESPARRVAERVSDRALWTTNFLSGSCLDSLRGMCFDMQYRGRTYRVTVDDEGDSSVKLVMGEPAAGDAHATQPVELVR